MPAVVLSELVSMSVQPYHTSHTHTHTHTHPPTHTHTHTHTHSLTHTHPHTHTRTDTLMSVGIFIATVSDLVHPGLTVAYQPKLSYSEYGIYLLQVGTI